MPNAGASRGGVERKICGAAVRNCCIGCLCGILSKVTIRGGLTGGNVGCVNSLSVLSKIDFDLLPSVVEKEKTNIATRGTGNSIFMCPKNPEPTSGVNCAI